jgi:hypothetical protein
MAETIRLNRRQVQHLVTVVVAIVLIVTAMTSSWWTRGYTIEGDPEEGAGFNEGGFADTFTVSYGPFTTPTEGPFQYDSVREVAVTLTGIAIVLSAVFAIAHSLVRWGIESGRLEVDPDTPVKLAIGAFWLGLFGVLFALLWPFMGTTNTGIFASELLFEGQNSASGDAFFVKTQEFLNVGFFLGIFAFIVYPAYLWASAEAIRSETTVTTGQFA